MQTTVYLENFEAFLQEDTKDIKIACYANSKPNFTQVSKKRKKVTFAEGENHDVYDENWNPGSPMKKSRIDLDDNREDEDTIAAIVI